MPERETAYLLLTGSGIPPTIFDSQVVEPLLELSREGLSVDLLAYRGLSGGRAYLREEDRRLERIRRALSPARVRLATVPFVSTRVGAVIAAVLAALHLWPSVLKGKTCICHCRGRRAGFAGLWVRRLVPRCRIVFDIRGDLSEAAAPGTTEYAKLKVRERAVVRRACRIICVSEHFRTRLAEEYPEAADRIVVIPCTANGELFRFDPDLRGQKRRELGVMERVVIAYCGGLANTWQIADRIVASFRELHARNAAYHLLLVTPDLDLADALVSGNDLDEGDVTVATVPHAEVPAWLMAADIGLLLRRPDPVNSVASPAKLAEYLMTGLPVVVSTGIGDSDDLISANSFGTLVTDTSNAEAVCSAIEAAALLPSSDEARADRAARAAALLSSQRYLPVRLAAYRACARPAHQGETAS